MKYKLKKSIKIVISSIFIIVSLVAWGTTIPGHANIISPHANAIQIYDSINLGGYFYNLGGQVDLHGGFNQNPNNGFITDEIWCAFDDSNWIELGDMDGAKYVGGQYWAGHFCALRTPSGYVEYTIGDEYPASGCSFEILKTDSQTYTCYVNGTSQYSLSAPYSQFCMLSQGIETNNNNSSFTNGLSSNTLMYMDTSGSWYNWGSLNTFNGDSNSFGWTSSYNSKNNSITFNHN